MTIWKLRWTLPLALALMSIACGQGSGGVNNAQASASGSAPDAAGQTATVLLGADFAGSWPAGLDPATNITGGANLSLMNAIYGGLLQLIADEDGRNPRIVGVLASGYEIAEEGRALIIRLRPGMKFSDGTPFDAQAVRAGMERNLSSGCTCSPVTWPWLEKDRITASDEQTVVLRFSRPYAAAVTGFPVSTLNWIPSPTALRELGETAFRMKPVGAGPFKVVENQLSSKLVLERNPHYWQEGRPYLDRLIFQSIASEQAAYQALLSGDAQAFEGMSSPILIRQAQATRELTVTRQPPTSPGVIQLNTMAPPFDNLRAREAVYYATNVDAIRKGLFDNQYPASQSFTAEGGLFHHPTIPGYRVYDLQKAREIVKEMGGLRVTLGTLRTPVAEQIITALQSQWKEAGIDVTVETHDLGGLIRKFQSHTWQALFQTAGSYDPDSGSGLKIRFGAGASLSGVKDLELDGMIREAAGIVDPQERDQLYFKVAKHISDKAYAPFLLAQAPVQVTRGLQGPGLTTPIPAILLGTAVHWQDVKRVSP